MNSAMRGGFAEDREVKAQHDVVTSVSDRRSRHGLNASKVSGRTPSRPPTIIYQAGIDLRAEGFSVPFYSLLPLA